MLACSKPLQESLMTHCRIANSLLESLAPVESLVQLSTLQGPQEDAPVLSLLYASLRLLKLAPSLSGKALFKGFEILLLHEVRG